MVRRYDFNPQTFTSRFEMYPLKLRFFIFLYPIIESMLYSGLPLGTELSSVTNSRTLFFHHQNGYRLGFLQLFARGPLQ